MSNKTISGAKALHGRDPQLLLEKITRERIYASRFWKEQCFGMNAESLIDRAVQLKWAGGCVGAHQKPTPFLCLLLKLLQLQPAEEIVLAYIGAEEHKYLRLLGAFYYRFAFPAGKVYPLLEGLLSDFRKIRVQRKDGTFECKRFDELLWAILKEERMFDVIMPRIAGRMALEQAGDLPLREPLVLLDEAEEAEIENYSGSETEKETVDQVTTATTPELDEIEQENLLRAKLGLKPLQR
jgi:pre-mRNA-splicing factor 38A